MAKKKIYVGWAMMRLNKAGNWVPIGFDLKRYELIETHQGVSLWPGGYGDYYEGLRAGTLKAVKMTVTM